MSRNIRLFHTQAFNDRAGHQFPIVKLLEDRNTRRVGQRPKNSALNRRNLSDIYLYMHILHLIYIKFGKYRGSQMHFEDSAYDNEYMDLSFGSVVGSGST